LKQVAVGINVAELPRWSDSGVTTHCDADNANSDKVEPWVALAQHVAKLVLDIGKGHHEVVRGHEAKDRSVGLVVVERQMLVQGSRNDVALQVDFAEPQQAHSQQKKQPKATISH
jgi:hypothetical protein